MFSKFFKTKPKWQHAKPAIRLAAIESFSSVDPAHQAILETIAATDSDATVRHHAVTKLLDTHKLSLITQSDADTNVRDAAQHRLAQLLTGEAPGGPSAEQRLAEVKAQQNLTVLQHLLAHGDEAIKLAALDQIDDEHKLEEIALHHALAKVRALAAERIEQPKLLQNIAKHSKGKDKKVYRITQAKLAKMRDQIRQHEQLNQQSLEICDAIETLARTEFSALYPPKLRGLVLQWEKLPNTPDQHVTERFDKALKECEVTLEQHDTAVAELEAQSLAQRQLDSCCHTLESQIEPLCQQEELSDKNIEAVTALLQQQQHLWQQLAQEIEINATDKQRFEHAQQLLKRYNKSATMVLAQESLLTQSEKQAQKLTIPADARTLIDLQKTLHSLIKEIAWPPIFSTPKPLLSAQQALTILAEKERTLSQWQTKQLPELKNTLQKLSSAIDNGKLQEAENLFHQLQQLFQNLPDQQTRAHQQRFAQLKAKIQELRDWRGFAGVQHKEDLCQRMEALVAKEIAPEEKAILIKQLQDEWKQLGPTGPANAKALWQRFREASDLAYAPCREFNHQQSDIRKKNLSARQTTCDQLESFLAQTDWEAVDWPSIEKIITIAKEEWRIHSPVDRKAGKALKVRFDTLITQLRTQLQTEYDRNIEHKQQLLKQAEALIEHDDLAEAIEQAKQLQQEWKKVGLTPRSANQKIWQSFRKACDAIFARRDEARHLQQAAREQQKNQAQELCSDVESLAQLADPELAKSQGQLNRAIETFRTLEKVPTGIKKRFDQACENYRQQLAGLSHRTQAKQVAEALRKARICDAIELSVLSGDTLDDALIEQWSAQINLPAPLEQSLRARLELAQQDAASENSSRLQEQQEASLSKRQRLCIEAEILAELASPAEAKEARIKYQLERFNQGLVAAGNEQSQQQQAWGLAEQWCKLTAAPKEEQKILEQRFEHAVNHCISAPTS